MTYYDEEIQAQDDLDTRERDLEALAALEKWVAGLRSGDYRQGHEWLYNQNEEGFCCVGVLSQQFTDLGLVQKYAADDSAYGGVINFDESSAVVPSVVAEYFRHRGLKIDWSQLYGMNDSDGLTFLEIADEIEQTYIGPLRAKLGL